MKKRDELADPKSCLNRAGENEQLFVLRERDPAFPATVEFWSRERQKLGLDGDVRDVALTKQGGPSLELVQGDSLEWLRTCGQVRAMFADPPDNIGLEYDGYSDDMRPADYYRWLEVLLLRALAKCEVLWLSYHWSHDLEVKHLVREVLRTRHPRHSWREFLWTFTFSQYAERDCAVSHRPILRLARPGWEPSVDAIREESERMRLGDPRAAGPRVPSNLWEFPRVVGNSRERRPHHPTQHPEALVERMVLMSCSGEERWVDLFAGSGTSLRVCKRTGTPCTAIELSEVYCRHLREEHKLEVRTC